MYALGVKVHQESYS